MADFNDGSVRRDLSTKIDELKLNLKRFVQNPDQLIRFLDDTVSYLDTARKEDELQRESQDLIAVAVKLTAAVNPDDSPKVVKLCQIWRKILETSSATLSNTEVDHFGQWIIQVLKSNNDKVFPHVVTCLSAALLHKEIKQSKFINEILSSSGLLMNKLHKPSLADEMTLEKLSILQILCNFTLCQGEKDWSSISKDLIQNCIIIFKSFLEPNRSSQNVNVPLLKAYILCFHGLENVFVRFHTATIPHLGQILGLCNYFMLYGIPGHSLQFSPLLPSPIPFIEQLSIKNEQGRTPKVRKKKPPKSRNVNNIMDQSDAYERVNLDATKSKPKISVLSSSDSEISDSDGDTVRQKENQAKVRVAALKTLTAAFKFCDQRTVISYWSAFLPDSSHGPVFRHSLMTPILRDSSVKVRCEALNALSTLLQVMQPTVAMAVFQEKPAGSFIPVSHTLAEMAVTVQRSLLLVLSAEQSNVAFIQLFKCLTVAATVFPYEKLPAELISKTVKLCASFMEFKDPDVKVACLSLLRVLICAHSSNSEMVNAFWDSTSRRCWLLEHCLSLIQGHSTFQLTLESLLVLGEVSRTNVLFAQPYLETIVHGICRKLQHESDTGIKIRCAKSLAMIGCSILHEMDKEHDQVISRDDAVKLWAHILRNGLPEALQHSASPPLRAEAYAALATIGSQIFECLPRDLRVMFAAMILGCAGDSDTSVRAAAVRTLGFAVTFNTLSDDASFILDSSEIILSLLKDVNIVVNLNSSWALGNLAETLEKNKCLLNEELPRHFLTTLIKEGCLAAQGPMKVRGNAVRALGIFLKLLTDMPADGSETRTLLDRAILVLVKQATTGSFMKNRWNACYAIGNVFQNTTLLTAFHHWMDQLLDCLLVVFRTCPNYKVRISAASALLHLHSRSMLSNHYVRLWNTLLESLAGSELIEDFAEYQHHERWQSQICNTLCKLITLMDHDDLSILNELITKYYDVCRVCFEKFLSSLLPDQFELMLEASSHIQQMKLCDRLSANQESALNLLNDLLRMPE